MLNSFTTLNFTITMTIAKKLSRELPRFFNLSSGCNIIFAVADANKLEIRNSKVPHTTYYRPVSRGRPSHSLLCPRRRNNCSRSSKHAQREPAIPNVQFSRIRILGILGVYDPCAAWLCGRPPWQLSHGSEPIIRHLLILNWLRNMEKNLS